MNQKNNSRPKSELNFYVNFLGVVFFVISIYIMCSGLIDFNNESTNKSTIPYEVKTTLFTIFSAILPILFFDLFILKMFEKEQVGFKKKQAGLSSKNKTNIKRVITKIFGLFLTFASIGFVYWLLPEYKDWYKRYFYLLEYIAYPVILLSIIYFPIVDRKMKNPIDGYWHTGNLFLSIFVKNKRKDINKTILAEHARGWIVKAFFFPLMFIFLSNDVNFLLKYNYSSLDISSAIFNDTKKFGYLFDFLYSFIFTLDVIFATVGYVMTFKILNSHIRSVEPTFLGWVVCIMCYPPFWAGFFSSTYFAYNDGFYWGSWLGKTPTLYAIWGGAILILITTYSFATIALGYRFSNLTYRGLITSGPYKYTKHPAYITKCLSWWLISIPFISGDGWISAVKMSLLLLGLCFIYFLRARTEENHLSNYSEYVKYAEWINKNGIFRIVGKILPFIKYNYERTKKSGSIIWTKKL